MLSRNNFVRRFCSKCRLCTDITLTKKPSFCFDFIYVKKPSRFINSCFPKIKITNIEKMMEGRDDIDLIKKVFCSSKVCGKDKICSPEQVDYCSDMFVGQILNMDESISKPVPSSQLEFEEFSMGKGSRKRKKKNKKNKSQNHQNQTKKDKKKKKRERKSSFIFGGGEEWTILIQSIMEESDEVKGKQQDNIS